MITADSIAAEIYLEIGSPCETKPTAISYWVKTNLGTLNNLICTEFTTPSSGLAAIVQSDGTAMIDSEYIIAAQSLPSAYLGVVFAYKFATSGDVSGGSNPTVTLTGGSTPSPASVLGIYAK